PSPTLHIGGNFEHSMMPGYYYLTYQAEDEDGNLSKELVRTIRVSTESTAIEEEGLGQYVQVFPNPSNGRFQIRMNLPESQHVRIEVVNALGKVIQRVADANISSADYQVDVSSVSSGLYFVRIETDNDRMMHKINIVR
ncbi:MAG: T9SS type A sorting domain-containing protein, partial [Bacteroidia bacterium]